MEEYLDLSSARSQKARFYVHYSRALTIASSIATALLGLLGLLALAADLSYGWLILSLGSWPAVILLWLHYDLGQLPAKTKGHRLDNYIAGDILGRLGANVSPRELYFAAVHSKSGGAFIFRRLAVRPDEFIELISNNPSDTAVVLKKIVELCQRLDEHGDIVSAPIVIAAVLLSTNGVEDILRERHADYNDLYLVVEWYEHINYLIKLQKKPRYTGGVARDWSFGYIPTLQHFGVNLSSRYTTQGSSASELASSKAAIARILEALSSGGRRNAALIGPFGAGKSAIVDKLADILMNGGSRVPAALKFNQVFSLDASAILSAANARGQVEGLVNQLLVEAYRAKNIILFLDNAELFFEDGTGAVDISTILQPVLEGGAVKLILSMNEQRFLQIAQTKPALSSALNRIEVKSADSAETRRVLEDNAMRLEFNQHVIITQQSINEAMRLSDRYIYDVAQPRKAVQLLSQSVSQAVNGEVTAQSVSATIEKTLGIKVGGDLAYNDSNERERLLNLESLIHQRMINQSNAVSAVASALRRARAGVRNENRPIGTFLFLGPTGVGKTELAKSLADVYFGGEGHMVRIDLNEYVRPDDVSRLIADGATDANSLSAQVQKNPFSVVLLDEIEKAHPNVLTTLLQVLDEGVLRDINNREISFRDTIVIATSNAGADLIRRYIDAGYKIEQFSSQIQNQLINSGEFKPEFLNRFDEIAVFRPLTKTELIQVIDLILVGINKNLAAQKVAVHVADEAKPLLVDAGYDPRLGARPMRRIVQKTVENIVAEKLLSGELRAGSSISLSAQDIQASLAKLG